MVQTIVWTIDNNFADPDNVGLSPAASLLRGSDIFDFPTGNDKIPQHFFPAVAKVRGVRAPKVIHISKAGIRNTCCSPRVIIDGDGDEGGGRLRDSVKGGGGEGMHHIGFRCGIPGKGIGCRGIGGDELAIDAEVIASRGGDLDRGRDVSPSVGAVRTTVGGVAASTDTTRRT